MEGADPARGADRRVALVGVLVVAAGYLGIAVFAAATLPWRGTADAFDHLDYVYQLLQGQLPAPFGHRWVPVDGPVPTPDGRQWVSQHPPLFYLLVGPLAAPFLDGDWRTAVALIRAANIVVGLGGLAALGWLGWLIGGPWRVRLAVALPAVGTASFGYVRYAAEVYNDTLVTTLSLLALALCARLVLRGITWFPLLLLAVVSVLGLGTKATFVVTLATVVGGVVVAAFLHADGRRGRALLVAIAAGAGVGLPPVLAWGWFYVRNETLSGSWYLSTPGDVPVLGRPRRSTWDVLGDPEFYLLLPTQVVGRASTTGYESVATWSSAAIVAVAVGSTLAVVVRARGIPIDRRAAVVVGGLFVHLAGHVLVQLSHASGYGAYNWRYFVPATAALALVAGLGVASAGRLSVVALPGLVGLLGLFNAWSYSHYGVDTTGLAVDPWNLLQSSRALAAANDLPEWLPAGCLVVGLAALAGLGVLVARNRTLFGAHERPVAAREPHGGDIRSS